MRILEARSKVMRLELDRGRGGDKVRPFPVSLEPPFTPFNPNERRQILEGIVKPQPQRHTPVPVTNLKFLRIRLSADDEYSAAIAEQLLLAFSPKQPMSFEVIGLKGYISLQFVVTTADSDNISKQILSHYPRAQVTTHGDLLQREGSQNLLARSYRLRESHLLCLRTEPAVEGYAALMGILTGLGTGQVSLLQVLFQPVRFPWRDNILSAACDPWDPSKSAFIDLPSLPKKAQAKVEKPLFAVAVRIAASSEDLLEKLEGGFLSLFDSGENGLTPVTPAYPADAIWGRYTYATGMLLNNQELAAIIHLPNPKKLADSGLELATPTSLAPKSATNQLVSLGINRHQGNETPVGISADWLTRHVAIFGATGYGKTTLLKRFLVPLIEHGYGFAFIDPAGDAAQEILDLIPAHRVEDVIYFDPGDREYPLALNVLEPSEQEQEMLTAEVMIGLKRIFHGRAEFGPRMEWLTRQAVRTLLDSEGEKTLRDIPKLLADQSYRTEVLKTVRDPELRWFWETRGSLSDSVIDPILNRLSTFLDRPTIRNIVSQPNLIDFQKILLEGRILICNLSKGILGEEHSSLLGSFILSKLQLATLSRAQLPPLKRRLFAIVVDEFQNYAGNRSDTTSIRTFLSEARKYGVSLVTATQYTLQLDRDVQNAIFGNVGTLICMHCGPADAQLLQRELGIFTADDILNLQIGQALVRMGRAASAFNVDIAPPSASTHSFKNQIIQLCRERYCRPRREVEAAIEETTQTTSAKTQSAASESLEPDELAFLDRAACYPEETVTNICSALNLSGSRGVRIRRALVDRGFLVEVETRLGQQGKRAKYAVPTFKGYQFLGEDIPKGRGGPVHKHFIEVIARWAAQKGYQISKEHKIPHGWVDLHLERDGVLTALELSVTSTVEREMNNLLKCLREAYYRVVMLFLDDSLLQNFHDLIASKLSKEELDRVRVGSLNEFHRLI